MKAWIKNALGDKVLNHYVPMSAANALTFADAVLDGTYKVFEEKSSVGSDAGVVSANSMSIFVKNTESGKGTYIKGIFKASLDTDEVRAALTGLTIDGFVVDHVVFINVAPLTFA